MAVLHVIRLHRIYQPGNIHFVTTAFHVEKKYILREQNLIYSSPSYFFFYFLFQSLLMSTLTAYADSGSGPLMGPAAHLPTTTTTTKIAQQQGSGDDDAGKKKKTAKRRKVNHACLYCRRSHMTCDDGRPCQRW